MQYDVILKDVPRQEAGFAPCFAFSINKCGSTMMNRMIRGVCNAVKAPAVNLPVLCFHHGIEPKDWLDARDHVLPVFTRNFLFYGFRALPELLLDPDIRLRERRSVLLVRDPRDALVSEYFSFGRRDGSHAEPKYNPGAFREKMTAIEDRGIDAYVLAAAEKPLAKLEAYRDSLNFDLTLLRRYEDVYYDKQTFLGEIFDHFGIAVPPRVIARVAAKHDIRPEQEDDTKHIRKGTPGDHAEKLKPETIAVLNDTFREVGAFYGYDL